MGAASDLRNGSIIKYNGENCVVLERKHVTPGKGPAHHQVKMRNIRTGRLSEARFRSSENVEFVRVEHREYQYLYRDGDMLYFMNMENYEQIPIGLEHFGDNTKYLKENQELKIAFEGEEILGVDFPQNVFLRIAHTDPGLKGDTATNVLKTATVETGATVAVPLFINEGDLIRIDTKTGEYGERVKE